MSIYLCCYLAMLGKHAQATETQGAGAMDTCAGMNLPLVHVLAVRPGPLQFAIQNSAVPLTLLHSRHQLFKFQGSFAPHLSILSNWLTPGIKGRSSSPDSTSL